jgi:mannose-6-phosphate isomerase
MLAVGVEGNRVCEVRLPGNIIKPSLQGCSLTKVDGMTQDSCPGIPREFSTSVAAAVIDAHDIGKVLREILYDSPNYFGLIKDRNYDPCFLLGRRPRFTRRRFRHGLILAEQRTHWYVGLRGSMAFRLEGMAFLLHSKVKTFDWGAPGVISEAIGTAPSGLPEAEIWWGDHPLAECSVVTRGGVTDFHEWAQGSELRFPLLVKLLAAQKPLSIQVHPSETQAERGFGSDEAAGIPLDAPERTYKDRSAKPELIIALSEEFVGLAGFTGGAAVRERLARWLSAGAPQSLVEEMESVADDPREAARRIVEKMSSHSRVVLELEQWLASITPSHLEPTTAAEVQLLQQVSSAHRGDAGMLFVLLMHHVYLERGQALFVPTGEVHAYVRGFGLEVMLPSDNVIRAGLTSKHKDIEAFLALSDFAATDTPQLVTPLASTWGNTYEGFGADFVVHRITSGSEGFSVSTPSVCFVESGQITVIEAERTSFSRGNTILAFPGEKIFAESNDAVAWIVHASRN